MKLRIKGFDKDLKCKNMQFEVGKEYKIDSKELKLYSNTVFHYCKDIQQVHNWYSVTEGNRFCWIEVLGEEVTDGGICGSNHIKIVREIVGEELNILIGRINGKIKKYIIFDLRKGLYSEDIIVYTTSPLKAVQSLYDNVRRVYGDGNGGNIVVNGKYVYDGEPKNKG